MERADQVESGARAHADGDATVYCVVPRQLATIHPRLCEHFANEPVEVVIDKRTSEEAREGGLKARLAPGLGSLQHERRMATPVQERPALPDDLRSYADELAFVKAAPGDVGWLEDQEIDWQARCLEAEQDARELLQALVMTLDKLRPHGPHPPMRFLAIARAERAIARHADRLTSNDHLH